MRNLPKEFKMARDFAYFNYEKFSKSRDKILKKNINGLHFKDDDELRNYIYDELVYLILAEKDYPGEDQVFTICYDNYNNENACTVCIGKNDNNEPIYANFVKNKSQNISQPWIFHSLGIVSDNLNLDTPVDLFFKRNNLNPKYVNQNAYEEYVLDKLDREWTPQINRSELYSHLGHIIFDHLNSSDKRYYSKGYYKRFPPYIPRNNPKAMTILLEQIKKNKIDEKKVFKFYSYQKDEYHNIVGLNVSFAYPITFKYGGVSFTMGLVCSPDGTPRTIFNHEILKQYYQSFKDVNPNAKWIEEIENSNKEIYNIKSYQDFTDYIEKHKINPYHDKNIIRGEEEALKPSINKIEETKKEIKSRDDEGR